MNLSNGMKAGAASALLLVAGLLYLGQASPGVEAPAGHIAIYLDGGNPAGSVAVWATVLADTQAQALFGYDGGTVTEPYLGGTVVQPAHPLVYARAKLCSPEVDGGDPGPNLLPGLTVVYDDATTRPCGPSDPALEAWVQGRADAPWVCACCPRGSTCMGAQPALGGGTAWGPAPPALTYGAGTWATDGGWLGKPCVELSTPSSMPAACL